MPISHGSAADFDLGSSGSIKADIESIDADFTRDSDTNKALQAAYTETVLGHRALRVSLKGAYTGTIAALIGAAYDADVAVEDCVFYPQGNTAGLDMYTVDMMITSFKISCAGRKAEYTAELVNTGAAVRDTVGS